MLMPHAGEAVQQAHEFVEGLDWEMLRDAAETSEAVYEYVRRHPWTLLAGGASMVALGLWHMFTDRARDQKSKEYVRSRNERHHTGKSGGYDPDSLDLMAP